MRDHELEEINRKLRDIQGKAAFEFWKVNILQASWMTDRWEDLSDDRRQQWTGLCEAETRAFLDAYPSLMEPYLRARGYPVSEGLPGERSEPGSAECLKQTNGTREKFPSIVKIWLRSSKDLVKTPYFSNIEVRRNLTAVRSGNVRDVASEI
jgi:hypothetical protein